MMYPYDYFRTSQNRVQSMKEEALLQIVVRKAGYPVVAIQKSWLKRSAPWQRALEGDGNALDQLVGYVREDGEEHLAELANHAYKERLRGKDVIHAVKGAAHAGQDERIDLLASRAAEAFKVYHYVSFWHRRARGWKIKEHRRGDGREGPWADVYVDTRVQFKGEPVRMVLRLGREPLTVEVPDRWPAMGRGHAPGWDLTLPSVFESLLVDTRAYASMLGWSEAQAFWYLVRGKTPRPEVTVRVVEVDPTLGGVPELAFKTVVLAAQDRAHARQVSAAFAKAVQRRKGAPKKLSTDAVMTFVDRKVREAGHQPSKKWWPGPPWPRLWKEWNDEKPPGYERFENASTFRKRYRRAKGWEDH
jgi:hypothetical protein